MVHDAMRFEREGSTPKFKGGNSFAEDRARQAATEIAALLQPIAAPAASGGTLAQIAEAFGCVPDDDDDLVEAARLLVRERDDALAKAASVGTAQSVSFGTSSAPAGDMSQGSRLGGASGGGEPVAWGCAISDGKQEQHTAIILDGLAIHVYQREEVFDGPSVREIMRWIRQVPIGNGRLPTD
jgi:hypothetical protein